MIRVPMVFLMLVASACGDGRRIGGDGGAPPGTDGGSSAGLTAEQYCDAFARANCDGNQRCCTDPTRMPATLEACMDVALPRCLATLEGDVFRTGRARLDPAGAAETLDAVEAAAAACVGASPYGLRVTEGTVGVGGDCSVTADDFSNAASCADGLGCAIDFTTHAGTCQVLGLVGASCGSGRAPCAAGLYCAITTSSTCEILRDDGESCSEYFECWSYYCDTTCGPRPGDPYYCL